MSIVSLADRIVCINLRERNDRFEIARQRFKEVGLSEADVEFLRVDRDCRGGKYGCYESHKKVIQQALQDGIGRLLVFEDDVEFAPGWEVVVEEANGFLELGIPFDALMLCPEVKFVDEKTLPNVWRVKSIFTHAYVVSREGMKQFLLNSEKFGTDLLTMTHDLIQNSVWQNIYAHVGTSICQDNNLGTDNNWLPDVPKEYAPWFQGVLVPCYAALAQLIVRSNWWRKSLIGQRYTIALDDFEIDDGRVRVKGICWVDFICMFFIMLCFRPPFGYARLVSIFVHHIGPALKRRLGY